MDSSPTLDFGLIQAKADRLMIATGNRLEREWPKALSQHPGSQAAVFALYKSAHNTYFASRYLLADTPPSSARKLEYALAAPPLVRSLVELLGTFVFLFEDLPTRTLEFFKGGWRDAYLDTERLKRDRGTDPSWSATLTARQQDLDRMKLQFQLTANELADPERALHSWPRLNPMFKKVTGARKDYLSYLNDWFYRSLSTEAHPTWLGLGKALSLLGSEKEEAVRRIELDRARTKGATVSLALMLALMTEIERELQFGEMPDLKYVWSILGSWDPDVKDFYEHVYLAAIGPAGVGDLSAPTGTA